MAKVIASSKAQLKLVPDFYGQICKSIFSEICLYLQIDTALSANLTTDIKSDVFNVDLTFKNSSNDSLTKSHEVLLN